MADTDVKPQVAAPAESPAPVTMTEDKSETVQAPTEAAQSDAAEATDEKDEPKPEAETKDEIEDNSKTKSSNDVKKNTKFDPSVLPESDDPLKIRTQVEFYFSDSNLPTDKFMWKNTGGTENKAIPLKTICNFGRMRRFQPYESVVAALKESKTLLVQGDEGNETVKRRKPYSSGSENSATRMASSVYVKGFGEEEPSTQFDLEAFFTKYGHVNALRLRRTEDKTFKGSVFVEFQDPETAKKFLELDPKPTWKGNELTIMSKKAYVDEKSEMIRNGEIEPSHRPRFFEGKEITDRRGRGGKYQNNKDGKKDEYKNGGGKHSRGRGRGGYRGGRGGGRGGRHSDRNPEARAPVRATDSAPKIQATNDKGKPISDVESKKIQEQKAGAKRGLEGGEEPPTKKIDSKAEA